MSSFKTGQMVRGERAGTFKIVSFREIDSETWAQLKPVDPATGAVGRGTFALPVSKLRAIGS